MTIGRRLMRVGLTFGLPGTSTVTGTTMPGLAQSRRSELSRSIPHG